MSHAYPSALVLQGGGALGAYELGAARRLYKDADFAPDVIAGVSIGAVTAALLARPARGLTPLQALETFWTEVTMTGWLVPPPLRPFASVFGNRNFFMPRLDVLDVASWTSLYDMAPLRHTLGKLIDCDALADTSAWPRLLLTATDVAAGQIRYFASHREPLALDHILASGSLPPSFPMTLIDGRHYWDGGLFDNTPLGAVLDTFEPAPTNALTVYVVNLFPNAAPLPRNMAEVSERMLNLQFANKTCEDVKLLKRFDEVAHLMEGLADLPEDHPARTSGAFRTVAERHYVRVPRIIAMTRPEQAGAYDGNDFSAEAIAARATEGYACTAHALAQAQTEPQQGCA